MQVSVSEKSPVERSVEVTLPAEDVGRETMRRLQQIGKRAKMPGFRKGKVPMKQLRLRHGQSARLESIQHLVEKSLYEALSRDDLDGTVHVSRPDVVQGFEDRTDLVFRFTAERFPEFEPDGYVGIKVEKLKTEVSDEEIDETIEKMRQDAVTFEPVEDRTTVQEGDVVVASYRARGEGEVEQIFADDQEIWLGDENLPEGLGEGIVGAEVDQSKDVVIRLPEEFSIDELAGEEVTLDLTVSEIKTREVPALDDDFASEVEDVETLDELREKVRSDLAAQRERQSEEQARSQLSEALREANDFEMPPLYVQEQALNEAKNRLREFAQQGMDPAQLGIDVKGLAERMEESVEASIREALILREIAEKEGLEVEDADIDAWYERMSSETGMPLARIRAEFGSEQARVELRGRLLIEKTRDWLWEKADITEVDELSTPEGDEDEAAAEPGAEDSGEGAADESADESAADDDSAEDDSTKQG